MQAPLSPTVSSTSRRRRRPSSPPAPAASPAPAPAPAPADRASQRPRRSSSPPPALLVEGVCAVIEAQLHLCRYLQTHESLANMILAWGLPASRRREAWAARSQVMPGGLLGREITPLRCPSMLTSIAVHAVPTGRGRAQRFIVASGDTKGNVLTTCVEETSSRGRGVVQQPRIGPLHLERIPQVYCLAFAHDGALLVGLFSKVEIWVGSRCVATVGGLRHACRSILVLPPPSTPPAKAESDKAGGADAANSGPRRSRPAQPPPPLMSFLVGTGGAVVHVQGASVTRQYHTVHSDYVSSLALLPDGRIASGSWDKLVRVWDMGSTEEQLKLNNKQQIELRSATHSNIVYAVAVVNVPTRRQRRRRRRRQQQQDGSSGAGPDTTMMLVLATACKDRHVRLWAVARKGSVLRGGDDDDEEKRPKPRPVLVCIRKIHLDAAARCLVSLGDGAFATGDEFGRVHVRAFVRDVQAHRDDSRQHCDGENARNAIIDTEDRRTFALHCNRGGGPGQAGTFCAVRALAVLPQVARRSSASVSASSSSLLSSASSASRSAASRGDLYRHGQGASGNLHRRSSCTVSSRRKKSRPTTATGAGGIKYHSLFTASLDRTIRCLQ